MCRLYGFLATEPTRLECSLVETQNALLVQSDRDRRGIRNPDGWGIAEWHSGFPYVSKNTFPAFADKHFVEVASTVTSHSVIAHIRAATVGPIALENTHPFAVGPWAFAHNGTIGAFDHVATHLELGSLGPPEGATDSELAFRWLLNRMERYGLDPSRTAPSLEPLLDLMEASLTELIDITLIAGADEPPALNFLISDGVHLVASRWGNSLYWTFRRGVSDCTKCGTSHCPEADEAYKAVVVASEPLTDDEEWKEVPEATLFAVDASVSTYTRSLASSPLV